MIVYRVWLNDKVRHFARRSEADAFVGFLGDGEVERVDTIIIQRSVVGLAEALDDLAQRFDKLLLIPEELDL